MLNADAVVHGSSNPLLAAEITFGCLLWPGDVFVDFDNNLNTAVGRLREALGDSAEHPHFIETLPKRGYRFIASVTRPSAGETSAGRVKLAVLPFANLSGDPAQEYFSDGITEELISRLAELAPKHLGVIAHHGNAL